MRINEELLERSWSRKLGLSASGLALSKGPNRVSDSFSSYESLIEVSSF
jgi:hypothetical protein